MEISSFRIRASYPNYFMVNLFAREGREVFNHDNEDPANTLEGNKPGTVIYRLVDDDTTREYPPRWYDMYRLLKLRGKEQKDFLSLLLDEHYGVASEESRQRLEDERTAFHRQCREYVAQHPLFDSDEVITTLTSEGDFSDEAISYKGHMLLDLTKNSYPVPDFVILTAKSFSHAERLEELLGKAIGNLETMTSCRLGDSRSPLVFAIRCAMPQYIPGLMPTLLNIGVTRKAYKALKGSFAPTMANRVYLSTLHTICEMLGLPHRGMTPDIGLDAANQVVLIEKLEKTIADSGEERLLDDAHYQALRLTEFVRQFYLNNPDLILTFMQGKEAFPSLILQRMVWTIGNNESYPGVLYSRHSRTGEGKQIESYRNIFGEEIMTGDVTTEDRSYSDRSEIRDLFPAVYHFDPLLKKLESRYKTPVTIEFAVESRPHSLSLFSVLQLNASEMTGRAALISSIDMLNEGLIEDRFVLDLIKPYHLRQIVSAAIDDRTLSQVDFFGHGLSVLPRTAISARLCFTVAKAHEYKSKGEHVCLCQSHFVPQDTVTLNELDAILSMMPAAIHVVTACRGYGIPAMMDLQSYGIHIDGHTIVNEEGVRISEGEMITISSRRQSIYKGQASFKPARFTKYLEGKVVELGEEEAVFFHRMKDAYMRYQTIVMSKEMSYISDISKLARLIRCNLQNQPEKASYLVNSWYESHPDKYVDGVLQSRMGDHNDQGRLFDLLTTTNKIDLFRRLHTLCNEKGLSGLRAGSFMIGRFVARPLSRKMWNNLSDATVAFLMNEYVLYEKYQQVLQEVGEIKLARAHSRIETEGIDNMIVHNFEMNTFIPLLYSQHNWTQVAKELENMEHQDNTHLLITMLSRPVDEIFDLNKPWRKAIVDEVLKANP